MTRPAGRLLLALAALAGHQAAGAQEIQPRMGDPLPGLTAIEHAQFDAGRIAFTHTLTINEGLGPILNDNSCSTCHGLPRVGGSGTKRVTRFGRAAFGGNPFDPLASLGGSLLQASANVALCAEMVPKESDVQARRVTLNLAGDGLIEAIRDVDLRERARHPPAGVSGRVHMVPTLEDGPLGRFRVGRFGWKAQQATLLSFSADASVNEMGFTNRFLPVENAPNGNQVLLAMCDTVADPEDHAGPGGLHAIDLQANFQRLTAPPPQTPRSGMSGATVFNTVGCASCHVATLVTGPSSVAALSGKTLRPYSDFLLHDMGTTLGDGIVQGTAAETELRTTPLWGLHPRAPVGLLHDGRATGGTAAQNVRDAILAHEGEALASRNAFQALLTDQQDRLITFLLSLGRLEFDEEGDHDVDALDWFFLELDDRFTGPGAFLTPDDPGAVADFDQDGDFDLVDFAVFQRAMTGDDASLTDVDGFTDAGSGGR